MQRKEKKTYYCHDCKKKVLKRQYSKQFEMRLCTHCLIDRIREARKW
jgi:ribosomal protein L37AE/L43A